MKFEFTIIASDAHRANEERLADRFAAAGCGDAKPSLQKGAIVLKFEREGASFGDAVSGAVADIEKTGARAERLEPDHLVSLSDIARRSGLTRAAIGLYIKGERRLDFPAPVARITTESPLWNWADVATWLYLYQHGRRETALQAHLVWKTNVFLAAKEAGVAPPTMNLATYLQSSTAAFLDERLSVSFRDPKS